MNRGKVSPGVWTVLALAVLVLLWEGAADGGHIDPFYFSRPTAILQSFRDLWAAGTLQKHFLVTVKEAALGLAIGGILGTLAGLGLGVHPRLSAALMPLMTGLNGVPKLALGPLFIIWLGLGLKSKVLISALMVFFIFSFNLYAGVRSVDRSLVLSVELLGGTRGQVLRKVIWPSSIPWLLASLRTGLGLSLSGAIVGEYLGASKGLGWAISSAGERYDTAQVLCYVLVIVVLVVVLDCVLRGVEKVLLRWQ